MTVPMTETAREEDDRFRRMPQYQTLMSILDEFVQASAQLEGWLDSFDTNDTWESEALEQRINESNGFLDLRTVEHVVGTMIAMFKRGDRLFMSDETDEEYQARLREAEAMFDTQEADEPAVASAEK